MAIYNAVSKTPDVVRSGGVGYSHSGLLLGPIDGGAQLANPDYLFTDDFSGPIKDEYTIPSNVTYGLEYGGETVVSANYAPEGIVPESGHANSELALVMPVEAVQVLLKVKQFVPESYSSAHAGGSKTFGFWGGPYGTVLSHISIQSECQSYNNNGVPSIYTGNSHVNYGHYQIPGGAGLPLWLEGGSGGWDDITVLLELAKYVGDYGRYRIWKNNTLIVDSDNDEYVSYMPDVSVRETLHYSEYGNYITDVRIFGWNNYKDVGIPAYSGTMHLLYKDLEIQANTTFKSVTGLPT